MTVQEVAHTRLQLTAFAAILKESKESDQMQLTAQGGNMVVDFYPEAIIADEGVKRFIKCVTFMPNSDKPVKSYSVVTKLTFRNEVNERLASGYEVTDYHTEKFDDYGTYSPCFC